MARDKVKINQIKDLQDELDSKSESSHAHIISDVTGLQDELDGKSDIGHIHDDRYYTETEVDTLLDDKSDVGHIHDDRYYTETEVDTLLGSKSDTSHTHTLDGLSDVIITSPSTNQILKYNGTNWVNNTDAGATNLDGLSDVIITSPATDEILKYNGTNWVNGVGSSGGLVQFVESKEIATPNATIPVILLKPSASITETNADIAISPKGTGSFALRLADNTATGGNKRGSYAVDLQLLRTSATDVASGTYSFAAGRTNKAIGESSIALGYLNTSTGDRSVTLGYNNQSIGTGSVAIGYSNSTTSSSINYIYSFGYLNANHGTESAFVGINNSNTTLSSSSLFMFGTTNSCTISGGSNASGVYIVGGSNTLSSSFGTTNIGVFGNGNNVTAISAIITRAFAFGTNNRINASYAVQVGHYGWDKGVHNAFITSSAANTSAVGTIQEGKYILTVSTTATGTYSLRTTTSAISANNIPALQNNEVRVFTGTIIARDIGNTGIIAAWKVEGVIARYANAASTVFVGTPLVTSVAISATGVTNGYALALVANTTYGGLEAQFTYTGGGNVKVVAVIDMTESM